METADSAAEGGLAVGVGEDGFDEVDAFQSDACRGGGRAVFPDSSNEVLGLQQIGIFVFDEGFDVLRTSVNLCGVGSDPVLAGALVVQSQVFTDQFEVTDEVDRDGAIAACDDPQCAIVKLQGPEAGMSATAASITPGIFLSDEACTPAMKPEPSRPTRRG